MSGDGWLCGPCHKEWDRQEQKKQPRPWFHREKRRLSLDNLPEVGAEDLRRARKRGALKLLGVGLMMIAGGTGGLVVLRNWLVEGGVLPALLGAAPLLIIIGAILTVWAAIDLRRA
jgi:hypothetical protein